MAYKHRHQSSNKRNGVSVARSASKYHQAQSGVIIGICASMASAYQQNHQKIAWRINAGAWRHRKHQHRWHRIKTSISGASGAHMFFIIISGVNIIQITISNKQRNGRGIGISSSVTCAQQLSSCGICGSGISIGISISTRRNIRRHQRHHRRKRSAS